MPNLLQRLRGVAIAITTLAISSTVALAAAPTVNIVSIPQGAAPASTGSEPSDAADPSDDGGAEPTPAADAHGAVVSAAARMAVPDGFANRGAFVSCVARLAAEPSAVDPAAVTPASCAAAADDAGAERGGGRPGEEAKQRPSRGGGRPGR